MTPRFEFRLAAVHQIRESEQKRAEEALAEQLGARDQERRLAAAADALVAAADDAARQRATTRVSGGDLVAAQLWRERLELHRQAAETQLEQAELAVEQRRQGLVEAHRRRSETERLREQALALHRQTVARAETAQLDELSQQMYLAQRRGR